MILDDIVMVIRQSDNLTDQTDTAPVSERSGLLDITFCGVASLKVLPF